MRLKCSWKAKGKMAAMLKMLRTPYARSYLHPYLYLSVHVYMHMCAGYTYVHPYLTKETLTSNHKGKRQSGRHAKTLNNTLCTYSAHITCIP